MQLSLLKFKLRIIQIYGISQYHKAKDAIECPTDQFVFTVPIVYMCVVYVRRHHTCIQELVI